MRGAAAREPDPESVRRSPGCGDFPESTRDRGARHLARPSPRLAARVAPWHPVPMNILIVGGGGREHAIAAKLRRDDPDASIYVAPGNPGTDGPGRNVTLAASDLAGLADFAADQSIDLTVIGPVSSGAEIMADGNIHVYGPLRGRALAGVRGNQEARIFCQELQAELVSVAGHYRISENVESELKGQRVHIYLQERTLHIVQL